MAPKHSFLFDMPVRFVMGMGITAGTVWTLFKPTDVALAQEESIKPKVLVRTASGAVRHAHLTRTARDAPWSPVALHSHACAHDVPATPRRRGRPHPTLLLLGALLQPSHTPLTSPTPRHVLLTPRHALASHRPILFAQIPPGLAGSESENSYTSRMGLSSDYKK